jgi:hypothetical protein
VCSDVRDIGSQAWLELLHAEVSFLLTRADVPHLVIKGPSISQWLYRSGERQSVDVDILVVPKARSLAKHALAEAGFVLTHRGTRRDETATHSREFHREDAGLGGHSVDLHWFFPGIDLPPNDAFELLWRERMAGWQAGTSVWFPSYPARALIIGLHAARSPNVRYIGDDLARVVRWADDNGWGDIVDLAMRMDAASAFRAGLETLNVGSEAVARAGLSRVPIRREWALRSSNAGLTALRLDELSGIPWRRRPSRVGRWLIPTPTLMRIRDPRAARSKWWLGRAYACRLVDGIKSIPAAIEALRSNGSRD